MHSQESSRLVNWKAAVRLRLHVEVGNACVFFVKEIKWPGNPGAGISKRKRFSIPAHCLHVHPPIRSLVLEAKPMICVVLLS